MVVKYCVIPSCDNNTLKTPNKIFIRIPENTEIRASWRDAINKKLQEIGAKLLRFAPKRIIHCCEDHFNLQEDAENWFQYKSMCKILRLKKNVVPYRNITTNDIPSTVSQLSPTAKKRKSEFVDLLEKRKVKSAVKSFFGQCQKKDETTVEESKKIKEDVSQIKEEPLDIKEELIGPDKSDIHNQKPFELNFESINSAQETTSNLNTKPSNIDAYRNASHQLIVQSIKTESISEDVVAQYSENNILEPVATILLPSIKRENCEAENYFDENEDPLFK